MPTASEKYLAEMQRLVDSGRAANAGDAYCIVMREHRDLATAARNEALERARSVSKTMPEVERVAPPKNEAHREVDRLEAEEKRKHPHLSAGEIRQRVLENGPAMHKILAQNRADHFARVRGKP